MTSALLVSSAGLAELTLGMDTSRSRCCSRPGKALMSVPRAGGDQIGLSGHNEVVRVQPIGLVCPPGDGDLAPLQRDDRMVLFALGQHADLVAELRRFLEVTEVKLTTDGFVAFDAGLLPARHGGQQAVGVFREHGTRAQSAGFAMLFVECTAHEEPPVREILPALY